MDDISVVIVRKMNWNGRCCFICIRRMEEFGIWWKMEDLILKIRRSFVILGKFE